MAHDIPPFDIRKGAAVAAAGVFQIPDAVHLIVVDPGVGGNRRDICIKTVKGTWLVGPDNGVLLPSAHRGGGIAEVYAIDPAKVDFRSPLATFHARDILAPVAAALVCGVNASALGVLIPPDGLVPPPFEMCRKDRDAVIGEALEADRFGSVRFNIPVEQLGALGLRSPYLAITIGHNTLRVPFAVSFADVAPGEPLVLVDSSGWLTLALNRASAEERFGIKSGAAVRIAAVV